MIVNLKNRVALLVTLSIVFVSGLLAVMAGLALGRVSGLLAMLVVAILVAYLVAPAATYLQRHKVPRGLSVIAIYLLFALIVGGAGTYAAPKLMSEAGDLARNAPIIAQQVQARLDDTTNDPLISRLPLSVRNAITKNVGSLEALAGKTAEEIGIRMLSGFKDGAEFLIRGLLILLLAFFFVTDAERITATFLRLAPARHRATIMEWVVEFDGVVGGFVRGQLLLAGITATAAIILLSLLHVKYGTILGLVAGVASIVPFVGPIVGTIPAIIICAATNTPVTTGILVVSLIVLFEIQGHVLTPIIIGRAVKVTPMVVFVAILAGAEVYGLLGTLLAIPAVGILRVALDRLFPTNRRIDALVHYALNKDLASKFKPLDEVIDILSDDTIHMVASTDDPYGTDEPTIMTICGMLAPTGHFRPASFEKNHCSFCDNDEINHMNLSVALARILDVDIETGKPNAKI